MSIAVAGACSCWSNISPTRFRGRAFLTSPHAPHNRYIIDYPLNDLPGSDRPFSPMFDVDNLLSTASQTPGVYRMLNARDEVIYVGKAGNLRKRLASYFRRDPGSVKTRMMVAQIESVEVTLTNTES